MKRIILPMIIIAISLTGCIGFDIEKGTPECVEKKIKHFNTCPHHNGANVKEFTFQDRTVYVFDPGHCSIDQGAEVIDSDCIHIGSLGGFTGNTIINGEKFSNAIFIKTIWEK